ncbi:MAG: hypothetical protein NTU61_03540 [Candidatus Altiarchaeota archaeon]|nr:hypothetical protein [Candidatus Altiarchaeota archaeon]
MPPKKFSNQNPEQIISHLANFLKDNNMYNLYIDPLGVFFSINEARGGQRKQEVPLPRDWHQMSERERREYRNKKRRVSPKIRSVKKGRTVSLKGREY